jgi:hypothetical protein
MATATSKPKNLMGKRRPADKPYETWQSRDGFVFKVLKFYQSRAATLANPYGRVLVVTTSPYIPDTEVSDSYYTEVRRGAVMTQSDVVLA